MQRTSPLKHPSVAPPFRILFDVTNYVNSLAPHPPNRTSTTTTHAKKTPKKLNGFQRGSLATRHPPPPIHTHPPPRLPFFLICYATYKTFEWHFAGGPMAVRHCVLAGIGYVNVLYRHLVALH